MQKKPIAFTDRQLRFVEAIWRTGRGGVDRSDIVRRALDARIDHFIERGLIQESDGGPLEAAVGDED